MEYTYKIMLEHGVDVPIHFLFLKSILVTSYFLNIFIYYEMHHITQVKWVTNGIFYLL